MEYLSLGGFNVDNASRNERLIQSHLDKNGNGKNGKINGFTTTKTGTTICGVVGKNCVVLAADTRSTSGPTVADKNCQKLHKLANRIYTAGAGTAADLEHQCDELASSLELLRLEIGQEPRVTTVVQRMSHKLFRYQGHIGCALVCGGYDVSGPSLYKIHPHGSTDRLPFAAMGSGSLHAFAILERGFKDDLTRDEAVALVTEAIKAGIFNDLGSGSNVDVAVITEKGTELLRNHEKPVPRTYRMPEAIEFNRGVTVVLSERREAISN